MKICVDIEYVSKLTVTYFKCILFNAVKYTTLRIKLALFSIYFLRVDAVLIKIIGYHITRD